jgi:magnesium transporter
VPHGVYLINRTTGAATVADEADLAALLQREDAWVWLDVPEPDDHTAALLTGVFGCHPKAVDDVLRRNHIARMHHYPDLLYLALHRPLSGHAGHVHYLELDIFIGRSYLVTSHGPRSDLVPLEAMVRETTEVAARMASGHLAPRTPTALAYAVVSSITNAEERIINEFAREVGLLEQRVMTQEEEGNPQAFLDELFTTRHTLLTVWTMASQSAEILARARTLMTELPGGDRDLLGDLHDQYRRLDRITKSQLIFLEGVTDFYRARNDTRMTIAGERLAVIAAVTLPIAAISGVMGMNVIVNAQTHWVALWILLGVMAAMSIWLLRWARKQGWW